MHPDIKFRNWYSQRALPHILSNTQKWEQHGQANQPSPKIKIFHIQGVVGTNATGHKTCTALSCSNSFLYDHSVKTSVFVFLCVRKFACVHCVWALMAGVRMWLCLCAHVMSKFLGSKLRALIRILFHLTRLVMRCQCSCRPTIPPYMLLEHTSLFLCIHNSFNAFHCLPTALLSWWL